MVYNHKFFPKILGEMKLGIYYISPLLSLKVDDDLRTIWIDLNTKKELFSKKIIGGYNFPIYRISYDSNKDFLIKFNEKYSILFNELLKFKISIPKMINIILNPDELGNDNNSLIGFIKNETNKYLDIDKKELIKIGNFVQGLPKEPIKKLFSNKNYTLGFGYLDLIENNQNIVGTQKEPELKKHNLSIDDISDCFSGIVLSDRTYSDIIEALGLNNIVSDPPKFPNSGGAIFIDQGGTGKSLIKSALIKLWEEKLGGAVEDKNGLSEFSGVDNYSKLIESWYFGDNSNESGYDKVGLFDKALENKVPSLLIIDEATRFVKSSDGEFKDKAAEAIIDEFKKYLNDRKKGRLGVKGYVLTLFIANVSRDELDGPLSQGGERLSVVYFGPPKEEKQWFELIKIYFKSNNLKFHDRSKEKDILLSNLIIHHNNLMPHEKFMIPPRKFGAEFCAKYLIRFSREETKFEGKSQSERIYKMFHSKNEKKVVLIHYDNFLKHIIDELLLVEVNSAGLDYNNFKENYYNFINMEKEQESNFSYSQDDMVQFKIIYKDVDTQRIIQARTIKELLGLNKLEGENDDINLFRKLLSKYNSQANDYVKFNDKIIPKELTLSMELIKELYKKIITSNPKNRNLDELIGSNFNFDKYKKYYNN